MISNKKYLILMGSSPDKEVTANEQFKCCVCTNKIIKDPYYCYKCLQIFCDDCYATFKTYMKQKCEKCGSRKKGGEEKCKNCHTTTDIVYRKCINCKFLLDSNKWLRLDLKMNKKDFNDLKESIESHAPKNDKEKAENELEGENENELKENKKYLKLTWNYDKPLDEINKSYKKVTIIDEISKKNLELIEKLHGKDINDIKADYDKKINILQIDYDTVLRKYKDLINKYNMYINENALNGLSLMNGLVEKSLKSVKPFDSYNELILYFESTEENQTLKIIGNDPEFELSFFQREHERFELFLMDKHLIKLTKFDDYQLTFEDKGIHRIKMVIKDELKNLCGMFKGSNIIGITGHFDVGEGVDFSYMFSGCRYLKNVSGVIENWDLGKSKDLSHMFEGCMSLEKIDGIQNWEVCNVIDFGHMFSGCSSIHSLEALKEWDVGSGLNFSYMFYGCSGLRYLYEINDWNVSKGKDFSYMFYDCLSLKDVSGIKDWDVSEGEDFSYMFYGCYSLEHIDGLKFWNISKGKDFKQIFKFCTAIIDTGGILEKFGYKEVEDEEEKNESNINNNDSKSDKK